MFIRFYYAHFHVATYSQGSVPCRSELYTIMAINHITQLGTCTAANHPPPHPPFQIHIPERTCTPPSTEEKMTECRILDNSKMQGKKYALSPARIGVAGCAEVR